MKTRAFCLTAFTLLAATRSLAVQDVVIPGTARGGRLVTAPDGVTQAERLALDPALIPTLLALPVDETVRLAEWPLAPGLRGDVRLTRRDVYDPDARLHVVDGKAGKDAPRSRLVFLRGQAASDEGTRVLLAVDPDTLRLSGFVRSEEGWTEMRPEVATESPEEYLLAPSAAFLPPWVGQPVFTCAQSEVAQPAVETFPFAVDAVAPATESITALRQMTLAVDTDNEFMSQKFSNNTTNATNYIATLIALMSVVYERDLEVRLLQGTTFLRVSTTADPYAQSGSGNADSAKLGEFRNFWSANYGGVSRALAMMLSGKQPTTNSASGIGYINSLCSTNSGYTFSQVFKYAGSNAASDTFLVAHENGHNFGSRHTHCYLSPTPIDTCYNGESGCYTGTTSCPAPQTINGVANVRGTLMSYCHQLGGCSASSVFHPRTVEILAPLVASKEGVCVFPVPGANPKEASPQDNMTAQRGSGTSVAVTYGPACGATQHTVYAGNLDTLRPNGLAWTQRFCSLGVSGSLSFTPAGNVYFVVAGNNGTKEGSYGQASAGERVAAGSGGACSYAQDLSGSCP